MIHAIALIRSGRGFTLVELVVIILILGVLAAVALPKFVNFGRDARIAAVQGLQGTLRSTAKMVKSKCYSSPTTCKPSVDWNNVHHVVIDGVIYRTGYGYPMAWSPPSSFAGIGKLVDLSGFTEIPYAAGSDRAEFRKDGAPDPANCKVVYWGGRTFNPTFTVSTTGC